MSYSVVKTKTEKYNLLEKDTDTVIELNKTESDARTLCRKLNLGSGFCGWTPDFFAKKVLTPVHR